LFAITATFLYFQQASLVRDNFHDRGAQTAFFAQIDLVVNVITLVVQLFFTGRIVGIFGVGLTLAILPALTLLGFGALAALPAVSTLVVFRAPDFKALGRRPSSDILLQREGAIDRIHPNRSSRNREICCARVLL